MDGYDICQRIENHMEILAEKLITNKVLKRLQTHLIVDFIIKLLVVAEKDVILVVYNKFFKIIHFVATTEKMLVKGLAWLFRDNI